jgi:hypothetical protein
VVQNLPLCVEPETIRRRPIVTVQGELRPERGKGEGERLMDSVDEHGLCKSRPTREREREREKKKIESQLVSPHKKRSE